MADTGSRIGWVGLGKMGLPMAARLLAAGHPLTAHLRRPDAAAALIAQGATGCVTLAEVGHSSDVVFSTIPDDRALRAITLGADGLYTHMAAGSVHIDMSTVSPAVSAEIAVAAQAKRIRYLRAPVSGSTALATAGTLTIIASGERGAFDEVLPLLDLLGRVVHYTGGAEQARFLKLAINMMVGISAAMIAEALVLGQSGDLDWRQSIEIINDSVVASPLLGYKKAALQNRDFTAAFTVSQMVKDLDLVLGAARNANVPVPVASMVRNLMGAMVAKGNGEADFFAYVTLMEDLAGRAD